MAQATSRARRRGLEAPRRREWGIPGRGDRLKTDRAQDADAGRELRARGYALFSRLYLRGVTEEDLRIVEGVPDLSASGPPRGEEGAALHHHLFGEAVPPYESVFVEEDGMLGGRITREVERIRVGSGLDLEAPSEAADHLGGELALLATLTRGGDSRTARLFLDGHLLRWVPSFVLAVERAAVRAGDRFWPCVARLTLEAVADHWAELPPEAREAPPGSASPSTRGALAAPAAGPDPGEGSAAPLGVGDGLSGARALARHLARPRASGIYLSREEIGALGRAAGLPTGFGRRSEVLETVLDSAERYGESARVFTGLRELVVAEAKSLEEAAAAYHLPPGYVAPWAERLGGTLALLERKLNPAERTA